MLNLIQEPLTQFLIQFVILNRLHSVTGDFYEYLESSYPDMIEYLRLSVVR